MKYLFLVLVMVSSPLYAANKDIALPNAKGAGTMSLSEALANRKTSREFSRKALSLADLSFILYAANGVNRSGGKRTSPTAMGKQYIDIYVVRDAGIYLYDAEKNTLVWKQGNGKAAKRDIANQKHIGTSDTVILFVGVVGKVPGGGDKTRKLYLCHSTAGIYSQNVYLACAARKVATGLVAYIKPKVIARYLKLGKNEVPLYIMPLGYTTD